MSNHSPVTRGVSFSLWLNKYQSLMRGFISIYESEPFDYDAGSAYEIGRQMAIHAKACGHKTKGKLIRRKPNSTEYVWVKSQYKEIELIARSLGFEPRKLVMRG